MEFFTRRGRQVLLRQEHTHGVTGCQESLQGGAWTGPVRWLQRVHRLLAGRECGYAKANAGHHELTERVEGLAKNGGFHFGNHLTMVINNGYAVTPRGA